MASAQDNNRDFVLFPPDMSYSNAQVPAPDDSFAAFCRPSHAMDDHHRFALPDRTAYDSYPAHPAQMASTYYDPNHHHLQNFMKVDEHVPASDPTPSASPSSLSQTLDHAPSIMSSASGASVQSTSSSVDGSPYVHATQPMSYDKWPGYGLGIQHHGVSNDPYGHDHGTALHGDSDVALDASRYQDFVDPSLIQHLDPSNLRAYQSANSAYAGVPTHHLQSPSPAPSDASSSLESTRQGHGRFVSGPGSPYMYRPYPNHPSQSPRSQGSPGSLNFDDEGRERTRCPHPDCGRPFKDLKAHMLTHQSERPEKCPITTCIYHQKGFARKYDKNRHTLTHYKGNMVCGFCPGSGSASEKSFNRADVFKRHLTSIHGVEQNPPNSRKKGPSGSLKNPTARAEDVSGKCSTCSAIFRNAQDFYEHLDDCVLRIVQQEEPSEAINERHLREVANDDDVRETLDRHLLPIETENPPDFTSASDAEGDEDESDEHMDEMGDTASNSRSGQGSSRGNPC